MPFFGGKGGGGVRKSIQARAHAPISGQSILLLFFLQITNGLIDMLQQ